MTLTQCWPVPLVAAQWLTAQPGVVPIRELVSGDVLAIPHVEERALHKPNIL